MLKKDEIIKLILVVIVPFLVVGILFWSFFNKSNIVKKENKSFNNLSNREIVEIFFKSPGGIDARQESIKVEVVNTTDSIIQGLSGRNEIGADGMLFVFEKKSQHYFWMKDMQFNIDIVWIADNKVVGITKNAQKPEKNTPDNRLKIYPSQVEADMVLELVAGDAHRYGITEGKTIQLAE